MPRRSLSANDSMRLAADLWMVKFERRVTQKVIKASTTAAIKGIKER